MTNIGWGTEALAVPPGRYIAFGGWFGHYEHPDHDEWFCNHCGEYIDENTYAWVLETDVDIDPHEEPGEVLTFHSPEHAYLYLVSDCNEPRTLIQEEAL